VTISSLPKNGYY